MTGSTKIYRVYAEKTIEYEIVTGFTEFFLSKEAAETYIQKVKLKNSRPDGSWIPNITSMEFYTTEVTLDDVTDEMTLDQFTSLFQVSLKNILNLAEAEEISPTSSYDWFLDHTIHL